MPKPIRLSCARGAHFDFIGELLAEIRTPQGFERGKEILAIYQAMDLVTFTGGPFVFHHYDHAAGINAYEQFESLEAGLNFFSASRQATRLFQQINLSLAA